MPSCAGVVIALRHESFLAEACSEALASAAEHIGFEGEEGFQSVGFEDRAGLLVQCLRGMDCITASSTGEISVTEIQLDDGTTAIADEGVTGPSEAGFNRLELEVLGSPCAVCDFDAVIGEPHAGQLRIAEADIGQGDYSIIARDLQIIDVNAQQVLGYGARCSATRSAPFHQTAL